MNCSSANYAVSCAMVKNKNKKQLTIPSYLIRIMGQFWDDLQHKVHPFGKIIITIIMESWKVPALQLKALNNTNINNKRTHITYIQIKTYQFNKLLTNMHTVFLHSIFNWQQDGDSGEELMVHVSEGMPGLPKQAANSLQKKTVKSRAITHPLQLDSEVTVHTSQALCHVVSLSV